MPEREQRSRGAEPAASQPTGSMPANAPDRAPRVVLVVGDRDTLHCGVKDYAYRLAEALAARGVPTEVLAPIDWRPRTVQAFRAMLRERHFDVIHVQYPSIGFRYSLVPHLLGLLGAARAGCVTLHEYSRLPTPQRWSAHLFRLSSRCILFTTEEERARFERDGGRLAERSAVIPIGSNVPAAAPTEIARRVPSREVIYFGQMRPDKGLEAFIELAERSHTQGRTLEFTVLGSCLPRHAEYVAGLRQRGGPGIRWRLDESFETVRRFMAEALAAYLPFPDGASFRRGSLVGALSNGTPVVTTISAATPPELERAVLPAATAEEALHQLDRLAGSAALVAECGQEGRLLAERFSWSSIAEAHDLLYRRLCAPSQGLAQSALEETLLRAEDHARPAAR